MQPRMAPDKFLVQIGLASSTGDRFHLCTQTDWHKGWTFAVALKEEAGVASTSFSVGLGRTGEAVRLGC